MDIQLGLSISRMTRARLLEHREGSEDFQLSASFWVFLSALYLYD